MPANAHVRMLRRLNLQRSVHTTRRLARDETAKASGTGVGAKGRTAGGEALGSTAPGAPQKPKVFNFSTPGAPGHEKGLSEEQKREVDEHNREFERTHERGEKGPENKVDGKFWNGKGARKKGEGSKE